MANFNDSLTLVILGASGNLVANKLIPALFELHRGGKLPSQTKIICVARTEFESNDAFRDELWQYLPTDTARSKEHWQKFAPLMYYYQCSVTDPAEVKKLDEYLIKEASEKERPNRRLYYAALSPRVMERAIEVMGEQGMFDEAESGESQRSIVLEKPFGRDTDSAMHLSQLSSRYISESQLFRIDHYLGKDMVQNLMVFRFANTIFEPIWNRRYIDHVQISVLEETSIAGRGSYYDQNGVLRDMFQNHLLQLLSLIAMEPPITSVADDLRDEKSKLLASVQRYTLNEAADNSVRAQYRGYHDEQDVDSASETATYSALKLSVDNWRWHGVPFFLRSGKSLKQKASNITVCFTKPPLTMFGSRLGQSILPNQLSISIQPNEGVSLSVENKAPGMRMALEQQILNFSFPSSEIKNPYERLLLDVIQGDQSLFIRTDEIERSWRIIDPFIKAWDESPHSQLHRYDAGSWGPSAANALLGLKRKWYPSE